MGDRDYELMREDRLIASAVASARADERKLVWEEAIKAVLAEAEWKWMQGDADCAKSLKTVAARLRARAEGEE